MDLTLDDSQLAMQQELRRFLSTELSPERRRTMMTLPGALDRKFWQRLADMGVFSLTMPEAQGGVGLGLIDATIVFEELGRALVPGPLVATLLAGEHVKGAASGSVVVGSVESGAPDLIVEHLDGLDRLLVIGDSVLVAPPPMGRATLRPVDPLTPVHHVRGCDVDSGERLDGTGLAERFRRDGSLLTAAFQVGIAQTSVDLATDYAKSRQQFGRMIGGFQAVKHLLADAASWTDIARAGVHAAAVAIDEDDEDDQDTCRTVELQVDVAGARLVASRAAHLATTTCIQVHGGMGYTWEMEAQLLLKRSIVLDQAFGGVEQAERTMELVL